MLLRWESNFFVVYINHENLFSFQVATFVPVVSHLPVMEAGLILLASVTM